MLALLMTLVVAKACLSDLHLPDEALASKIYNTESAYELPCLGPLVRTNKFLAATEAVRRVEEWDLESAIEMVKVESKHV